jgi:hypothetical protein
MHCSHVNYTPHGGKHNVGRDNHVVSGEMSISRRGFLAVTKLICIHPTTNFYATSTPKTFLRILTIDFMHPIDHNVPWFKFQILKKHDVLRLWSPCFMHCSHVNYTPPSGKYDVGGDNHSCVRWNIHLMERFLHGNKINFFIQLLISIQCQRKKNLRILTIVSMHPIGHQCHDLNFKF